MALVSPGVQVTVTDQANYAPTALGSVAYILLATAQDKPAPGGTAIAPGTLAENAGKVYTITSQRDLVTTFGTPIFQTTSSGAPLNADELNEYGLLTAYSALGVSNTIYVQRANVDLAGLQGTTIRPLANPSNGTYWLDTSTTNWGIYEFDAGRQSFVQQTVTVISSSDFLVANLVPNVSVGTIGSYAVNVLDDTNPIFYKRYDNTWQLVGNIGWQAGIPTITGTQTSVSISANANIKINTTNVTVATGANLSTVVSAINSAAITGVTARASSTGAIILTATSAATNGSIAISNGNNTPLTDLGITAGTYLGATTQASPYYTVPEWQSANLAANTGRPTGSVWQKASVIGSGLAAVIKEYNSTTETWVTQSVPDYADVFAATLGNDPTGGGLNVSQGAVFTQYDVYGTAISTLGNYFWYRKNTGATTVIGSQVSYTGASAGPNVGAYFSLTTRANATLAATTSYTVTISTATINGFIAAVAAAAIPDVYAELDADGAINLVHELGGDMILTDGPGTPLANVGIDISATNVYDDPSGNGDLVATNWAPLTYTPKASQPYVEPADNTTWYYNTPSRVDIMISNGSAWLGYRNLTSDIRGYNLSNTNSTGPIISTTAPSTQDDGTALVYGDLWIDTSDLENYPVIYRWVRKSGIDQWLLIDNTDATSQNGIIFADARWATSGNVDPAIDSIPPIGGDTGLNKSNYLDLDAPDPALYPRGIMLFNTRASGYNVKQFKSAYFTSTAYPNETLPAVESSWVTVSGYDATGTPNFGRKAQRGVVVAALKSAIDSSTALREDQNIFNLITCPGYPELVPNMVALNEDRDNTAFIIGDTPMRLAATGTAIQGWAQNTENVSTTSEYGLNTSSPYVGVYYPSGQSNDLSGASVAVPPSYAVLRSIIKSDNISYPWLAPAGTRRGLIDNLNTIGYVDATSGEFISIGVTQGLRDVMYTNKINPLTRLPGTGLLIYGQKTLSTDSSSMDRINVSRLVNYLRLQLNTLARPFLFEPNDPITRQGVTTVVNSLLNDLVAKRGITDYLVVCDTTNNTPARISRNELWVDVAVQPTKDVEFIYIPIRLKNPGEIQAGNLASATTVGTGA